MRDRLDADGVLIVGAGIAGLVAALLLAQRGVRVRLFEKEASVGGKLAPQRIGGAPFDGGPTVLTLLDVLEELLQCSVPDLRQRLGARPAQLLARHWWRDGSSLDLHADAARTMQAIRDFSGPADAAGYERFVRDAAALHEQTMRSYLLAERPSATLLLQRGGLAALASLLRLSPFRSLWQQLGTYFEDVRLRQLFARYATYVGSSPFRAPATLATIAHVERRGVWLVDGGLHRLATLLAERAAALGAEIRCACRVRAVLRDARGVSGLELHDGERVAARSVIAAVESDALSQGLLGADAAAAAPARRREPSLSAIVALAHASVHGVALAHHSVFFSANYEREFAELTQQRRVPSDPTIYVCAQDRRDDGLREADGPERLLCLVNAPALRAAERIEGETAVEPLLQALERHGLRLQLVEGALRCSGPAQFAARFPGSAGALYGAATHGWRTAFERPLARTRLPGLYRAGGSCHPGAGVPLAAISGKLAVEALCTDWSSTP